MSPAYSTTPRFREIQVGDRLAPLEKQPSETQLFMFSAITWDTHRTHWDIPYSVENEKLPGILVHGQLQGSWLTQLMTDWVMPHGRVAYLRYENRGMAIQNDELFVQGRVKAKREGSVTGEVTLELWVEKENGEITTTGEGRVELPLSASCP